MLHRVEERNKPLYSGKYDLVRVVEPAVCYILTPRNPGKTVGGFLLLFFRIRPDRARFIVNRNKPRVSCVSTPSFVLILDTDEIKSPVFRNVQRTKQPFYFYLPTDFAKDTFSVNCESAT